MSYIYNERATSNDENCFEQVDCLVFIIILLFVIHVKLSITIALLFYLYLRQFRLGFKLHNNIILWYSTFFSKLFIHFILEEFPVPGTVIETWISYYILLWYESRVRMTVMKICCRVHKICCDTRKASEEKTVKLVTTNLFIKIMILCWLYIQPCGTSMNANTNDNKIINIIRLGVRLVSQVYPKDESIYYSKIRVKWLGRI